MSHTVGSLNTPFCPRNRAFRSPAASCSGQVATPLRSHTARLDPATARRSVFCSASAATDSCDVEGDCPPQGCLDELLVADVMTAPAIFAHTDESIFSAIQKIVDASCSGLPVCAAGTNEVVGVLSGYDFLALNCTPGRLDRGDGYFPRIDKCINEYGGDSRAMWSAFKDLRRSLEKENGSTVGEVMHEAYMIGEHESLDAAADMIVKRRLHRLCVVDEDGGLIGVLSRGDVMRATIENFKYYMAKEDAKAKEEAGDKQLTS